MKLKNGKYIRAVERPLAPGKITAQYAVESTYDTSYLGEIKWYGPWRGYAFYPYIDCVFEPKCLNTICEWIAELNQAHREAKRSNT